MWRVPRAARDARGICDRTGRWLARTDTTELERRYGPLVMIYRARLFDLLRAAIPTGALRSGAEVEDVRTDGEVAYGGRTERAGLVVGPMGSGTLRPPPTVASVGLTKGVLGSAPAGFFWAGLALTSLADVPHVLRWGEPAVAQAKLAARIAEHVWGLPVGSPDPAGYVD